MIKSREQFDRFASKFKHSFLKTPYQIIHIFIVLQKHKYLRTVMRFNIDKFYMCKAGVY